VEMRGISLGPRELESRLLAQARDSLLYPQICVSRIRESAHISSIGEKYT
jgi:hypothetical protein